MIFSSNQHTMQDLFKDSILDVSQVLLSAEKGKIQERLDLFTEHASALENLINSKPFESMPVAEQLRIQIHKAGVDVLIVLLTDRLDQLDS